VLLGNEKLLSVRAHEDVWEKLGSVWQFHFHNYEEYLGVIAVTRLTVLYAPDYKRGFTSAPTSSFYLHPSNVSIYTLLCLYSCAIVKSECNNVCWIYIYIYIYIYTHIYLYWVLCFRPDSPSLYLCIKYNGPSLKCTYSVYVYTDIYIYSLCF